MRILVTFAVEAEFAPWRKRHDFEDAETSSDQKVYRAKIGGAEVFVGLTGIGPAAAASKICGFTWCEDLDVCISSGFAGALRPGYVVADVLAAREILTSAAGVEKARRTVESTNRLLVAAEKCGARIVERFYSSPTTIRTANEKARLSTIADAVEMESFEVLSEALVWAPEVVAIRAVSDSADEDLPLDFDAVVSDDGQLSIARLAGEIIRKPGAIPGLVRLGRRSGEAAKRLADFLDSYVATLGHKSRFAFLRASSSI